MLFVKRTLLPLMLSFLMLFAGMATAMGATVSQDGLTLSVTTDKTSYDRGETIKAFVSLKNEGDAAVSDITVKVTMPEDYAASSEDDSTQYIPQLKKGETIRMTVDLNPVTLPGTGDSSSFMLWAVLLLLSGMGAGYLMTHPRDAKRMFSLLLVVMLTVSGVAAPVSAQASTQTGANSVRSMLAQEPVTVAGKQSVVSAEATYTASVGDVTREQWIAGLLDTLDIRTDSQAVVTFNDYEKASDAKMLQTAINQGILEPDVDRDYVELVRPDEAATRDFIAHTANNALKMHYAGDEEFVCTDYDQLPHPQASHMAVSLGMLNLIDGAFSPYSCISSTEKRIALEAIARLLNSTNVNADDDDYVNFAQGVKEVDVPFMHDEQRMEIRIPDSFSPEKWDVGSVYVLHSLNEEQQDLAIKVKSVSRSNGYVIIRYEQPQLHEVVTDFNLTGTTSSGGYFIPAEGVEFEQPMSRMYRMSRATVSDTLPLFGAKSFKLVHGDYTFTGKLDIKSLDYRFSASPNWRFPFISIDEVYSALNVSMEISGSRSLVSTPGTNRKLLGVISAVPLGYGFFAAGPVYADLFTGEISVELSWGMDAKLGVQYTSSSWIRPVFDLDPHPLNIALKGELKVGLDAQVNVNFLGLALLAEGAKAGFAGEGKLVRGTNMEDGEFCLDIGAYFYFTLYTQIGPDGFCKIYETEVFNSNNSIWKKDLLHAEETGMVEQCTRGSGKYMGAITDRETGEPIYRAKVTLYKTFPSVPEEVTYTDSNGVFMGTPQSAGRYKMRITAGGYVPYECTVDIIGGNTTRIAPQMMLSRETTDEGILRGTVSGRVTDAMTGGALRNATVSVYNMALPNVGNRVATAHTDSNGNYSITLNAGVYEVVFTKDEYIPNGRFLTVLGNTTGFNASLNPENQSSEFNSLRAVLHWGSTPRDLDSHLVGPQGGGRFHTYFSNRTESNANLDVDVVTGYGPETTTILRSESGKYSFYVHDYTNRLSGNSSQMSNSGAYINLYNGDQLLYTIHVPTGNSGTLWHVFDYDGDTKQIDLINSFSYQSSPQAVGSSNARMRFMYDPSLDLKPYAE